MYVGRSVGRSVGRWVDECVCVCVFILPELRHVRRGFIQYAFRCCVKLRALSGCAVANAASYSSGCVVSACTTGWKVSDDYSECDPNVCSCPDGTPASGATCAVDGGNMCQSCGTGFKLSEDKTACYGNM